MTTTPETPELDKMQRVRPESQLIGAFLDWLRRPVTEGGAGLLLTQAHVHTDTCGERIGIPGPGNQGLARCGLAEDELLVEHEPIEKLLARYFEIDLTKVEEERVAILEHVRRLHEV